MIKAQDYEKLLVKLIENYSKNSIKVEKIQPPQNSPAECLENKTSYFGYALLNYKNLPVTLQFLYPTERGSFIFNGNEMSPSFQAVNISKKKASAENDDQKVSLSAGEKASEEKYSISPELSQFLIYPAPLLFLKKRLETMFVRKSSAKTSDFEADYLEGLLNQTSFRKLSAYDDINLLAETASRRKIALPGGENMPSTARFLDNTHQKKICPL